MKLMRGQIVKVKFVFDLDQYYEDGSLKTEDRYKYAIFKQAEGMYDLLSELEEGCNYNTSFKYSFRDVRKNGLSDAAFQRIVDRVEKDMECNNKFTGKIKPDTIQNIDRKKLMRWTAEAVLEDLSEQIWENAKDLGVNLIIGDDV